MQKSTRREPGGFVGRVASVVFWLLVVGIGLGLLLFVPVAAIVLALVVLSQSTLSDALLIAAVLTAFTVGYWGLVSWADASGLARHRGNALDAVEATLDPWDEGAEQRGTEGRRP